MVYYQQVQRLTCVYFEILYNTDIPFKNKQETEVFISNTLI